MADSIPAMFRAFDVVVQSDLELPELEACIVQTADVTLNLRPAVALLDEFEWFHHWYGDEQKTAIVFSIAREPVGYRLRFPRLADFLITDDYKHIACEPEFNTPLETIRHLFLDQLLEKIAGDESY